VPAGNHRGRITRAAAIHGGGTCGRHLSTVGLAAAAARPLGRPAAHIAPAVRRRLRRQNRRGKPRPPPAGGYKPGSWPSLDPHRIGCRPVAINLVLGPPSNSSRSRSTTQSRSRPAPRTRRRAPRPLPPVHAHRCSATAASQQGP